VRCSAWHARNLMRSWCLCVLAACLNVATLSPPAGAEEAQVSIEPRSKTRGSAERSGADQGSANIRVDSELVLIPVTVTDGMNRFVTGLDKDHFRLYEDKVEQIITHLLPRTPRSPLVWSSIAVGAWETNSRNHAKLLPSC